MELKIEIAYQELWNLIQQLPAKEFSRLKNDLENRKHPIQQSNKEKFKELLLSGPVMREAQYQGFQANREYFNRWRVS